MTWALDTSTQGTYGTSNPSTLNHTCSTDTRLLVLVIFVNGTTARTGGAPTYNTTETFSDSGQGFVYYTGGEAGCEVWYLINPSTGGSYTVSVPNTGSANIDLSVASFEPSAGSTVAYHNSNSATGDSATWSVSVSTTVGNCLMIGGVGSGERDIPGAGTNYQLIHTYDAGNQVWGSEYDLDSGSSGSITVDFQPARADDWGLIGVAFEEISTTPASDSRQAYIKGSVNTSDSRQAYIAGGVLASDSRQAYVAGGVLDSDSREAYTKGQESALDNREAYIAGSLDTSDSREGYIEGVQSAVDSREAYIAGQQDASDSREAYTACGVLDSDSREAYIEGAQGAVDSREAYIHGSVDDTDSREAYIKGQLDTTDSREAYIAGGVEDSDNREAFIYGSVNVSSNLEAYINGSSAGVPVTDVREAYIYGRKWPLPVTEDWTGADDDEWRRSHWESSSS